MFGEREPIRHPGNQALFRALDLSILSTLVGLPMHVHAEGLRGTGKTTIMRSVRRRLPLIQRIKGCVFNCVPWAPHCPEHRGLGAGEVRSIGTEWVPMPFHEISHSAKVGTVAGSIDLARIADRSRPEVALLPGTLPQTHRGIIFIDEINRLADTAPELADILLDVMGTKPGRLQVEETGLPSIDLPIAVSVWAASNPDEDPGPLGDIRKQLSDRFDFVIAMERPSDVETVRDILRTSRERQLALAEVPAWVLESDVAELLAAPATPPAEVPVSPLVSEMAVADEMAQELAPEAELAAVDVATPSIEPCLEDWARLADAVRGVECPAPVDQLVASLYVDFGLESLRGVEAIHHGARMNCVLEGRSAMSFADISAVAPGALQHRLDVSTYARVLDHLAQLARTAEGLGAEAAAREAAGSGESTTEADDRQEAGPASASRMPGASASGGSSAEGGPDAGQDRAGSEGAGAGGRGDAGSREQTSGWQSLWSIFGRRQRLPETGSTPGTSQSGRAGGDRGLGDGRGPARAQGSGEQAPGGPGQGGQGSSGGRPRAADDPAVAPPHAARPLADILRQMELGGPESGLPRVP